MARADRSAAIIEPAASASRNRKASRSRVERRAFSIYPPYGPYGVAAFYVEAKGQAGQGLKAWRRRRATSADDVRLSRALVAASRRGTARRRRSAASSGAGWATRGATPGTSGRWTRPPGTGAPTAWIRSSGSGRRCRPCAGSPAACRAPAGRTAPRARPAAGDSRYCSDSSTHASRRRFSTARNRSNARSRSAASADSAGITKANRALRSGFVVRSSCVDSTEAQPGTWRTASSRAIAISSCSASARPGTRSSRRQIRSSHDTPSGVETVSRKALNHAAF